MFIFNVLGRTGIYSRGAGEQVQSFGDLGRLVYVIWGAKTKYFQGAEDFFRDLRRSMHYFEGARVHRPPWGPL